ncbi:MAG: hypothetical protein HQK68_01525 [Desulfamplus sp.]|nr:hypothetical protein [Desulfamplus sp.]
MDKKKLAAITAAVFTYIKTKEATEVEPSSLPQVCDPDFGKNQQNYPNIWGLAGRTSQMNMRSMMQMRAFK